ncbi:hypothetical protein SDJN02_00340 [Cucurbita argyrosperma subsp. argyrosperma]|nr:hypothetical protein SDJN02_00340 [Cucurbita argyrosperma subsp. argyrosperma]
MATEELPPYPQMILRAIEALNSDNGSNKSTISKYIESTYENLPTGHSSLLTLHLNMMKASGELVFWKNNYMKRDPSAAPRRGRGRPPKPKEHRDSPIAAKAVKMKVSSGTGKPRGRPRKLPQSVTTTALPPPSGRPRGRPPKVKALLTEVSVL